MEVAVAILLGKETRIPIDAALHKELGQSGWFYSGATGVGLSVWLENLTRC